MSPSGQTINMKNEVHYLMNQKQLNRFRVISMVIEGKLKIVEAAESLNLSQRQIKRLKKGVIDQGVAFLTHKNSGKTPSHAIDNNLKTRIVNLKNSDIYKDANFLHFKELLATHEGINISYSALYSLLTNAGITSPKKRRKSKQHPHRKKMQKEGLLIQVDATPFEWFGDNVKYSLHGAIDDATGKIAGLYMCENECLQGYLEVTRYMISNSGIPSSIYADRHSIFRSPKADKISIEDQLNGKVVNETQFGRAMSELGITIIPARSPQAKGRVERLWETLQSRLPVEFKIAKITTVDQANAFLAGYISKFNNQFSVEPVDLDSAYRQVPDNIILEHILCVKQTRIIDNGCVFSIYNRHFQVIYEGQIAPITPKSKVIVLISPWFGVKVSFKEQVYDVLPFVKAKKSSNKKSNTPKSVYRPPVDHYFKSWNPKVKVAFTESDAEILQMLYDVFYHRYA